MLRKLLISSLMVAMLLASVSFTLAGDKPDNKLKFWLGYVEREFNDTIGTGGEYSPEDSSVAFGLKYVGYFGKTFLSVMGWYGHEDDMMSSLYADFGRVFKVDASYDRMTHNLLHDPLTNLEAVEFPKVTSHEDLNPDSEYSIVRSEFKAKAKVSIPSLPWLKVEAGYRMEGRHGKKQALTMSHCANCHVVSMDQNIDQTTNDFTAKAQVVAGRLTAVYSFLNRDFEEAADSPTHTYQDAVHPASGADVFTDRISYDADDGVLNHTVVPDSKKTSHSLKMQYDLSCTASIMGSFISSNMENGTTGLTADFNAYTGKFTLGLGKKAKLTLRGRYVNLDSDDVIIDINEPTANGGPYVGKTFREVYDFDPDWTRKSAMNRENLQFDAKLYYKVFRKSNLSIDYRYKKEDRENYFVTDGETDTVTNRFRLRFSTRALKKARFSASYEMDMISRPFANVDAACAINLPSQAAPSPLNPNSTQYYEIHDARVADISNQPSEKQIFKAKLFWNPSSVLSASANIRWNKSSNDELDYSEWSKDVMMGNLNIQITPSPKFFASVSYVLHTETDQAMFCVPVFDG